MSASNESKQDVHVRLIRDIVRKNQPISFGDIRDQILLGILDHEMQTSEEYLAAVLLGATANLEPARILYPDIEPFLVVAPDGRFGLKD